MSAAEARDVIAAAEEVLPSREDLLPPRRPFPLHALPDSFRNYVQAAADAMGVPPEMIALPLLSAAGAAIGTTRVLRLQAGARGWRTFPILWTLVSARSGSKKSPALELGLEPLRIVDRALERASTSAEEEFQRAHGEFEARRTERSRSKKPIEGSAEQLPTEEPRRPPWHQAIVSDVTIECLGMRLAENPRGLLVTRDELGAWFASFGAYKSARSGEAAAWLELYRGGTLKVDRVGRSRVRVPMAAVSIAGGIQPDVLEQIGREHVEDGMLARFLIAEPVTGPKTWSERSIAEEVHKRADSEIAALAALRHEVRHSDVGDEELVPHELALTREAKAVWNDWYEEHAARQARSEGPYSYALAKIEEAAARLALICALIENPEALEVDSKAMRAGVELARWFALEAERLYTRWSFGDQARKAIGLEEWIERQGPKGAAAREVAQHLNRFHCAGGTKNAEAELEALVASGRLRRLDRSTGKPGRPCVRFAHASFAPTPTECSPATVEEVNYVGVGGGEHAQAQHAKDPSSEVSSDLLSEVKTSTRNREDPTSEGRAVRLERLLARIAHANDKAGGTT